MQVKFFLLQIFCFACLPVFGQKKITILEKPTVSAGKIIRYENFKSKYAAPRTVDVWLPDDYLPKKVYPVLYLHDGQMLFDSTTTFNRQEWGVDETLTRLTAEGRIRECIVVAIWNTGETRHAEYAPQKVMEKLTPEQREQAISDNEHLRKNPLYTDGSRSDAYLKFIVRELRPYINRHFSTMRDRANTFIGGSSMGGLISIYALCEYPKIFGGAMCLSTHWPVVYTEENPITPLIFNYLEKNLPEPRKHKIYFDYGTATLDALYPRHQKRVDEIMRVKNFSEKNWMTREFAGADHSEKAWRERLHIPLEFLLGH